MKMMKTICRCLYANEKDGHIKFIRCMNGGSLQRLPVLHTMILLKHRSDFRKWMLRSD